MRSGFGNWSKRLATRIVKRLKFHIQATGSTHSGALSTRFASRLRYWWEDPSASAAVKSVGSLIDKRVMRRYIQTLPIDLPKIYVDAKSIQEIDFDRLPNAIVIKPSNGSDSNGVMLIDGEKELLRGITIPRPELGSFCQRALTSIPRAADRILVEEFLCDYDPRFVIPRDFKVYVAGGRAWIIQVIDRNPPKEQRNHSFYTREWVRVRDVFQKTYEPGPSVARPILLPELLEAAELIARDIGAFFRLDFYLTKRGVVFGEFTADPFAGMNFTPYGEEYLCRLMDRFPDAIPQDWSTDGRHRADKIDQVQDQ
jgi:hypothetical protein